MRRKSPIDFRLALTGALWSESAVNVRDMQHRVLLLLGRPETER